MKTKKLLAMMIVVVMTIVTIGVMPATQAKADGFVRPSTDILFDGGWYGYINEDGNTASITGCLPTTEINDSEIIVPEKVAKDSKEYTVIKFDNFHYEGTVGEGYGFKIADENGVEQTYEVDSMTKLQLPDTVTSFGDYVLCNFGGLTELILPNNNAFKIDEGNDGAFTGYCGQKIEKLSANAQCARQFILASYTEEIEGSFFGEMYMYYCASSLKTLTVYDFDENDTTKELALVANQGDSTALSSLVEINLPGNILSFSIESNGDAFTIPVKNININAMDWSGLTKVSIKDCPEIDMEAIKLSALGIKISKVSANKLEATVTSPFEDVDKTIVWTSTNPAVATIAEDGTITDVGYGTTTFKATNVVTGKAGLYEYTRKEQTTAKPPVVTTTKSPVTTTKKVTAPAKAKISKIKAGKKKVSLKLKKVKDAKGYKIQYATNKKFKKAKSKTTTKLSYTFKKLKSKKTYYFRVKAYKVANGKKIYSTKWSSVKKAKVK